MSESAVLYKITPGGAARLLDTRAGWCRREPSRYQTASIGSTFTAGRMLLRERGPAGKTMLAESILHAAWRKAGANGLTVSGRDGHRYRIVYPGRPADGSGPDFRDAVLLRDDGVRIHGDIEVHVRSGDWHAHGHGRDRAYNGVVLHVALEETGAPVETMSKIRIPLLLLKRDMIDAGHPEETAVQSESANFAGLVPAVPLPFLDMSVAGDEWFRNRVHGTLLQISVSGADQALWEGALECLGFPANKRGFRQIASRLSWETLSRYGLNETPASLEALFAWVGGFGPKPDGAPRPNGPAPKWASRHGRPANNPATRLRAAAAWAARWRQGGGPARVFVDAIRRVDKPHELLSVFTVQASPDKNSPLGKARAADVVVNQLLPAVQALAVKKQDGRLASRVKRLWEMHPPLQTNSVTREASNMLRVRGVDAKPRSARDQQGLIHIYRMATARQQPDRQLPLL